MECPICKRKIRMLPSHAKKCFGDDPDWKYKWLKYNYRKINKDYIEDLYIKKKFSIPMIGKDLGGLDNKNVHYLIKYFGFDVRSIKETRTLPEYRERIEKTNVERFGTINPLSKESPIYEKRNETVRQKYGVENVFQCIDKFVSEEKLKKRGKYSTVSSLNKKIMNFLDDEGIEYNMEFRITDIDKSGKIVSRFYDFRIDDLIIEAQGRYYHADPRIYKETDVIRFPKSSFTAKELWEKDIFKKQIAIKKGFRFLAIWENEIKNDWNNVKKQIKNSINKKS